MSRCRPRSIQSLSRAQRGIRPYGPTVLFLRREGDIARVVPGGVATGGLTGLDGLAHDREEATVATVPTGSLYLIGDGWLLLESPPIPETVTSASSDGYTTQAVSATMKTAIVFT